MKRLAWWINAAMLLACVAIMIAANVLWVFPRRVLLYPSANTQTQFAAYLHGNGITLYHTTSSDGLRLFAEGVNFPMTGRKGLGKSVLLWGGMYQHEALTGGTPWTNRVLAIRLWLIILLAGVYPTCWALLGWRRARRRSRHDPRAMPCPDCGSDLRASPQRCPECGAVPVGHGKTATDLPLQSPKAE